MGFEIEGRSHTGNTQRAVVNDDRFGTSSRSAERLYYKARNGYAFTWYSSFVTGGANVEVIAIQNNESEKRIVLHSMIVGSTVAQIWTPSFPTGTAAGTAVTATSLNAAVNNNPEYTAYGNNAVTGLTPGTTLEAHLTAANDTKIIPFNDSVIIESNKVWTLSASANGTVYVTVIGYFEPKRGSSLD